MDVDYHGTDWPLRVTKYRDDEEQEIVYSAKPREKPVQLRKILGYYAWIFNAHEEVDREVEPGSHGFMEIRLDRSKTSNTKGKKGRKKGKKKSAPMEDADPAHVMGEFDTCDTGSAFVGLCEGDTECTWVFDHENLVEKAPEDRNINDDDADFSESKFCITVVDVLDDNGHPFVEFTHSPGMHDYSVIYIGKKQKTKTKANRGMELEGLTDGERQRLGIFVEEAEIKRVALEKLKMSDPGAMDPVAGGGPVAAEGIATEMIPRKRKAEVEEAEEERPSKR